VVGYNPFVEKHPISYMINEIIYIVKNKIKDQCSMSIMIIIIIIVFVDNQAMMMTTTIF
jgi:hypothetical protein